MLGKLLKFGLIYLVLSLFAATASLVETWPLRPHSPVQWILLFVIALPVTALAEWLSDRALHNPLSRTVEARTRGSRFSWLRIAYVLAMYILFATCIVAIFCWLQSLSA